MNPNDIPGFRASFKLDAASGTYVASSCSYYVPYEMRVRFPKFGALNGKSCPEMLVFLGGEGLHLKTSDRYRKAPGLDRYVRGLSSGDVQTLFSILFPLDPLAGERFVPTSLELPELLGGAFPGPIEISTTAELQNFLGIDQDTARSVPVSAVSLEVARSTEPRSDPPAPPSLFSRPAVLLGGGAAAALVLVVVVLLVVLRRRR